MEHIEHQHCRAGVCACGKKENLEPVAVEVVA